MICIWMKDAHHMYEFAPGCKSRERGLSGGLWERELNSLGWRKVLHYVRDAASWYRTGMRLKPLSFALLEVLQRCVAIRCWQVNCMLSGQLSVCQCSTLWLSKIFLGSPARRGYLVPCLLGGDHYLTCINFAWVCVSFLTMDHIIFVTRHPGKSGSIPPRGA